MLIGSGMIEMKMYFQSINNFIIIIITLLGYCKLLKEPITMDFPKMTS